MNRDRWTRLAHPSSWLGIAGLMIVWVLLWGDLTWGNVLAGLLLGVAVTTIAPMPHGPRGHLAFRPVRVVQLVVRFLRDIVVASGQIAWMVLSGRQPEGAIIRVRLRAHSDVFLAATSGLTSIVPGSNVIDAHRMTGTLYIHVFDVAQGGGLEKVHEAVLAQEERLLWAFASRDQLIDAGLLPGPEHHEDVGATPPADPGGERS